MNHSPILKLIIVANSSKMVLFEAEKNKIIDKVQETKLNSEHHHYHTDNKNELERMEASKEVSKYLEQLINDNPDKYKELVLVAEPQMLGKIREVLSSHLKQLISKELSKDLVGHDMHSIESIIFSE